MSAGTSPCSGDLILCSDCDGTGSVRIVQMVSEKGVKYAAPGFMRCFRCRGAGQIEESA